MVRPAVILPLLLLSLNCYAGCNVAIAGGDTISLLVGKSGCLRSAEQRQAFSTDLKLAVRAMENAPVKGTLSHPAPAAPVFYGQRQY